MTPEHDGGPDELLTYVEELATSWVNGNRKDVRMTIVSRAPSDAAALALLVAEGFNKRERQDFTRFMAWDYVQAVRQAIRNPTAPQTAKEEE